MLKLNRVSGRLLDLLWDFDNSACKEKHDVIYALLGLVTNELPALRGTEMGSSTSLFMGSGADVERLVEAASSTGGLSGEPPALDVDYGKPWYLLFTHVAARCIRNAAFPSITRHLYAFGSLHGNDSDRPSWVPDWSRPRRPEPKRGISNEVPLARSIHVVDGALHIYARWLDAARNVLIEFPPTRQDFRAAIARLLQGIDNTAVPTASDRDDGDGIRDLTISETILGDLIRGGLKIGLCKPVAAESQVDPSAWIVNDLSSHNIARFIFTPEWRGGDGSKLDGIRACLQDASLFVTDALHLGIGPARTKYGDKVVLIDDYHGMPDLDSHLFDEVDSFQSAAVLRSVEEEQREGHQLQTKNNARYVLIGPGVLARRKNEIMAERMHIRLV